MIRELLGNLSDLRTHAHASPEAQQKLAQITLDLSKLRGHLTKQLEVTETLLRDQNFNPSAVIEQLQGDLIPILRLVLQSPSPFIICRAMRVADCIHPTEAKPLAHIVIKLFEEHQELQATFEKGVETTRTFLMSEAESALYSHSLTLPAWAKIRFRSGEEPIIHKLLEAGQEPQWHVRAKAFSILASHHSLIPTGLHSPGQLPKLPAVAAAYRKALSDPQHQVVEAALENGNARPWIARHFQRELTAILTSAYPVTTKHAAFATLDTHEAYPLKKNVLATVLPFVANEDPALVKAAIKVAASCITDQRITPAPPLLLRLRMKRDAHRAHETLTIFLLANPNADDQLQLAALRPLAVPDQLPEPLIQRAIALAERTTGDAQVTALALLEAAKVLRPEVHTLARSLASAPYHAIRKAAVDLLRLFEQPAGH